VRGERSLLSEENKILATSGESKDMAPTMVFEWTLVESPLRNEG